MQPDSTGRVGAAVTWKDLFASQRLSRDLQRGRAPPETPQPFASLWEEVDMALRQQAETSPPCSARDCHLQPPIPLPPLPLHSSAPHLGNPLENPKYVVNACVNLVSLITSGRLISLAVEPH